VQHIRVTVDTAIFVYIFKVLFGTEEFYSLFSQKKRRKRGKNPVSQRRPKYITIEANFYHLYYFKALVSCVVRHV
jgi:hypothetical protein